MLKQGSKEWLEKRRNDLKSRITINEKGCWIWNGPRLTDGYGNAGSGYPCRRAHRASYHLFKHVIPEEMLVLHTCDTPICINPEHLYLGNVKQNVKDALERGIFPRGANAKKAKKGESNGRAIMTLEKIDKMKSMYRKPYGGQRLGKIFGISKRQVYRILKGESWKSI